MVLGWARVRPSVKWLNPKKALVLHAIGSERACFGGPRALQEPLLWRVAHREAVRLPVLPLRVHKVEDMLDAVLCAECSRQALAGGQLHGQPHPLRVRLLCRLCRELPSQGLALCLRGRHLVQVFTAYQLEVTIPFVFELRWICAARYLRRAMRRAARRARRRVLRRLGWAVPLQGVISNEILEKVERLRGGLGREGLTIAVPASQQAPSPWIQQAHDGTRALLQRCGSQVRPPRAVASEVERAEVGGLRMVEVPLPEERLPPQRLPALAQVGGLAPAPSPYALVERLARRDPRALQVHAEPESRLFRLALGPVEVARASLDGIRSWHRRGSSSRCQAR
mmetsp:Transcript_39821/g.103054  ORF Transcript_39821/g.103054 Transcript_39821/m.103054 type:complete len:339 (+) Transcript_39821:17-1033(+)